MSLMPECVGVHNVHGVILPQRLASGVLPALGG